METPYTYGSPVVINQQPSSQVWLKIICVVAVIAALVFAFLWCTTSTFTPKLKNSEATPKEPAPPSPPPIDLDDYDMPPPRPPPPRRPPMPEMPMGGRNTGYYPVQHAQIPDYTGQANIPDPDAGPPPPIKVGRDNNEIGDEFREPKNNEGPKPYVRGRTKGVRIKL